MTWLDIQAAAQDVILICSAQNKGGGASYALGMSAIDLGLSSFFADRTRCAKTSRETLV